MTSDPISSHWFQHTLVFLSGSTVFGIIAHFVQTFPTPANKYGAWFLGGIQYAVGQRTRAMNTISGNETISIAATR